MTERLADLRPRLVAAAARAEPRLLNREDILTTMGLLERCVTDWTSPAAMIRRINVKLGVPACSGDRLLFTGTGCRPAV